MKDTFKPKDLVRQFRSLSNKKKVRHCPTGFNENELAEMTTCELLQLRSTTSDYLLTKSQICQNKLFFFLLQRINKELAKRVPRNDRLSVASEQSLNSCSTKFSISNEGSLTISSELDLDIPDFMQDREHKNEESQENDLKWLLKKLARRDKPREELLGRKRTFEEDWII